MKGDKEVIRALNKVLGQSFNISCTHALPVTGA